MSAASVVGLKMFTTTTGLAVNTTWNPAGQVATHSYLTVTRDGGNRWNVVSHLPSLYRSPLLAFVSPSMGYIADVGVANSMVMTTNRGLSWTRVPIVGGPTSVTVSGGAVWVTSDRCPSGVIDGSNENCWTSLSVIKVGASAPTTVHVIPSDDPALRAILPKTITSWTARLVARTGPSSALVVEGNDGPNILLTTTNSGSSWHAVVNPCGRVWVDIGAVVSRSRWYMLCSTGGGMNQSTNVLYETYNAGRTWTLLAEAHIEGPNKGGIDGFDPGVFGANASGRFLWLTDSLGFVDVSTDGGQTWHFVRRVLSVYTAEPFVSVGDHAWLANYQGGLIRTSDGLHWNLVQRAGLHN